MKLISTKFLRSDYFKSWFGISMMVQSQFLQKQLNQCLALTPAISNHDIQRVGFITNSTLIVGDAALLQRTIVGGVYNQKVQRMLEQKVLQKT